MISLIAAIGKNNELGKNNNLIWNLPNDLKFFKEKTLEHKIIMGLNTYNSIGKPLPRRKNIVITDKKIELPHEVTVYYDMEKLIENEINDKEEVFSSHFDEIIKASHNIIDLIEVGDYVNGSKVIEIEKDYKFIDNEIRDILWLDNKRNNAVWKETIKSIVTKEQFSSMEYRLGGKE